jgi:hypothetical protein
MCYPNLAQARVALDILVNAQSADASTVTDQSDGKWVIRHGSTGSLKAWIENDKGATVRMND